LALIAILKNVLMISSEILSSDVIIYIIIYISFITSLSAKEKTKKTCKYDTPPMWSILIILITLAIVAVYAL
jgi:hypothetical protein